MDHRSGITCPELAENLPFDKLLPQNAYNKKGAAVLPPRGGLSINPALAGERKAQFGI